MRTILSLAVGFWLGRQLYVQYDKAEALKREQALQKRMLELLAKGKSDKDTVTELNQLFERP